jgi:RimJ/RimL family protein N-acetyltransferase
MEFTLRAWHINDLQSLVKHANNFNVSRFLMDRFPHPYTEENGKAFIGFATQGNPQNIFAIDINGEACGGIGLHPQDDIHKKNAELGYWLAEPFWGKGIITRAIPQVVDYGFKNFDIDRIFARPFGNNPGSQKVLEKTGFTLEGRFKGTICKNGECLDELIYAVRRKK